jgi:hypothetical protein
MGREREKLARVFFLSPAWTTPWLSLSSLGVARHRQRQGEEVERRPQGEREREE